MENFIKISQSNLSELLTLKNFEVFDTETQFFLDLMITYFQGDEKQLASLLQEAKTSSFKNNPWLSWLAELRWLKRSNRLTYEKINLIESQVSTKTNCFWAGELLFFIGICYEDLNQHKDSVQVYEKAARILKEYGAERKAVKALHNKLAAEDRQDQLLTCRIADYQFIANQALDVGEKSVAGTCYINISREYQKLGSTEMAMLFANRAQKFLMEDLTSINYFFLVAHQCELCIELKRYKEARLKLNELKIAPFAEIKPVVPLLQAKLENTKSCFQESTDRMNETWRERVNDLARSGKKRGLGEVETQIIEILSRGPADKNSLIQEIYGENVEFFTLLNRFKVCLSRLRKKWPGLIVYENSQYRIANDIAVFENRLQGHASS